MGAGCENGRVRSIAGLEKDVRGKLGGSGGWSCFIEEDSMAPDGICEQAGLLGSTKPSFAQALLLK